MKTEAIEETINEFQVWLDLARRDGYPEIDYLAVNERLAIARTRLAVLKKENEELREAGNALLKADREHNLHPGCVDKCRDEAMEHMKMKLGEEQKCGQT